MEIVEIKCPRSLDLTALDKQNIHDNGVILQTIDIYDSVIIKQEIKKETGLVVISKDDVSDDLKDKIKEIILIYSKYTGIKIDNIVIELKRNEINILEQDENILAGLLIGLNNYFKTDLTLHELIFLGKKIDSLIAYYLIDGYKRIDNDYKVRNNGNNPYTKYYLIKPISTITKEELLRMKEFIEKYPNLDYGFANEIYFIAVKDNIPLSIPISLKKEFSKTKIYMCKNASENKILIKYFNKQS